MYINTQPNELQPRSLPPPLSVRLSVCLRESGGRHHGGAITSQRKGSGVFDLMVIIHHLLWSKARSPNALRCGRTWNVCLSSKCVHLLQHYRGNQLKIAVRLKGKEMTVWSWRMTLRWFIVYEGSKSLNATSGLSLERQIKSSWWVERAVQEHIWSFTVIKVNVFCPCDCVWSHLCEFFNHVSDECVRLNSS